MSFKIKQSVLKNLKTHWSYFQDEKGIRVLYYADLDKNF